MPATPDRDSPRNFLVVGAGYCGRRVIARLPADSTAVATRPAVDLDRPNPGLPPLKAPVAVLYTVPPAPVPGPDPRLAALAGALPIVPTRFVYLSTTGVYGDRGGDVVDETCPVAPRTERARRRVAAESWLDDWCRERGVERVVLRIPGIYGPGRLGLDRIERGEPILCEADSAPGNRIHVDDLAGACIAALTSDVPGGIYNVGDGDHLSSSAFTRSVAREAGLPSPPEVTLEEARRTFSPARLSFIEERRVVNTTRMRRELGFTPFYTDPAEGIRASLRTPG